MERQYMAICGFHMAILMLYKTQIWPIDYPISHSYMVHTCPISPSFVREEALEKFGELLRSY